MSVHKIAFLLTTMMFHLNAIINPYGPTVVSDCANCIDNIIKNEFIKPGLLIFANTNNVSSSVLRIRTELLKTINKKIKFSVEVMSPNKEIEVCDQDLEKFGVLHVDHFVAVPSADYFIIIIDSYKDFSFLASKLTRSRSWNPFANFIILLFNFHDPLQIIIEYMEKILSCLFKYNVINIVIALPQANNYRTATIYSWDPYDPPKYCGYFNETAKNRLIVENVCEHGKLRYNKTVFRYKIPHDMKGCVLKLLALPRQPYISANENDANLEKVLVNRILKRYNMTGHFKVISGFRGERENVGEWDGGLKRLVTKESHVLLGGIFPDFDVHEDFECSLTYLADAYTWVVPRAGIKPRWVAFIMIFHAFVWYSSFAGFAVCVISWRVIGQLCGDSPYNRVFSHCFLNTWIVIFGFVSYKRPVKQGLRIFFVFLNLYSVLFLTAYQTKLFDMLKTPLYEYQMQTVEELISSGLKFGGSEELHDLFMNSSDPLDYYIADKWVDVENMTAAMIDVAVHRNFSVLCSRLELAHVSAVMSELSDTAGNYKFYAFEGNMFSVPIEMVALRGFPFIHEFSNTITLFKQSGLNDGLRERYAAFNKRRRARLLRALNSENKVVSPLSISHLQGGFLALGLGYVGGFLALIVEVVVNIKTNLRKVNNK